jgi:hypothetical protein
MEPLICSETIVGGPRAIRSGVTRRSDQRPEPNHVLDRHEGESPGGPGLARPPA